MTFYFEMSQYLSTNYLVFKKGEAFQSSDMYFIFHLLSNYTDVLII